MSRRRNRHGSVRVGAAVLAACAMVSGCMVGPDFKRPEAPTAPRWNEVPTTQPAAGADAGTRTQWWEVFDDPVLDRLVESAYHQNLTLRTAGLRVLEARAARGIAVGEFFPQLQQVNSSYTVNGLSRNNAVPSNPRFFNQGSASFDVAWELDVWGKFRRGIESANASVYGSVMNYDDALVTLVADVATAYVTLRGLDERIRLAQENVRVQQGALDIANVRFRAGGTTELDVQQARAQLTDTQALVPALQLARRQTENQLCVLLGLPPSDLAGLLGTDVRPVPAPPDSIAVGIPADLLRRRPDVRRAEADAAAQSALIGVATSDLLPHFQLFGSIGYTAEHPGDLFNSSSLAYQAGPGFRWDILNYGRIMNNVRVQDARFEQLVSQYQNTVLAAQRDVANAITSFVRTREEIEYLSQSTAAGSRAVELAMTQYKAGGADFIRVLDATRFLVGEQDRLVISQTDLATSAIALNRSLGGGWEIRTSDEFVPEETIRRMRDRTNWGNITGPGYATKKDLLLFPRSETQKASPSDVIGPVPGGAEPAPTAPPPPPPPGTPAVTPAVEVTPAAPATRPSP